jgi:glutamate receptor, ionotropic, invertebrate
MLKETLVPLFGNDRYEGFGIELIDTLATKLGFNYTFKIQEDGAYGSPNKDTGQWDGMIRELMDDRADLAITDLTITAEREAAVDFTMVSSFENHLEHFELIFFFQPFMTLGISILFEKPKKEDPSLFSFLQPFSTGVWGCLFACFFMVTLSLFVMGRMSPEEWDNPYPCIEEPEVLINQFSFKNAMWFSIGALLQQGSEIAPK